MGISRPQLAELMGDARRHEFDQVLVWNVLNRWWPATALDVGSQLQELGITLGPGCGTGVDSAAHALTVHPQTRSSIRFLDAQIVLCLG